MNQQMFAFPTLAASLVFGTCEGCLGKVLSAGECGVKPRGLAGGISLSAPCLFHQHMCSVKPWPSPCHIEYSPPPARCGLAAVHCGCWSGAAEVMPAGTSPRRIGHITNVSPCDRTQPALPSQRPHERVHVRRRAAENPRGHDFCPFSFEAVIACHLTCTRDGRPRLPPVISLALCSVRFTLACEHTLCGWVTPCLAVRQKCVSAENIHPSIFACLSSGSLCCV